MIGVQNDGRRIKKEKVIPTTPLHLMGVKDIPEVSCLCKLYSTATEIITFYQQTIRSRWCFAGGVGLLPNMCPTTSSRFLASVGMTCCCLYTFKSQTTTKRHIEVSKKMVPPIISTETIHFDPFWGAQNLNLRTNSHWKIR